MNRQQHDAEFEQTSASTLTPTVPITDSGLAVQRPDETLQQPLSQEEREAFLAKLQEQAQRQKRRYRALMAAYFGAILCYLAWSIARWQHLIPHGFGQDFMVLIPMTYGVFMLCAMAAGKGWQRAASELAGTADLRYIGPLIEAYMASSEYGDKQHSTIREVLIERLPQLRATDAHFVNTEQRKILNRLLGGGRLAQKNDIARLAHAILKAYQQIGDSTALPVVEQVASGAKTGKDEAVRRAALDCIPYLRQRADAELANQQLLRAADGNAAAPEFLLRPAASSSPLETDPQQLLRAERSGSTGRRG